MSMRSCHILHDTEDISSLKQSFSDLEAKMLDLNSQSDILNTVMCREFNMKLYT